MQTTDALPLLIAVSIPLISGLGAGLNRSLTQVKSRNRLKFIQSYEFSEALRTKFRASRSSLDTDQQEMVFTALQDYFYLCNQAGRSMVSMPSQIVDDAWHEFILFTKDYDDFCSNAFGRFLHHTPAEAMETPLQAQDGIKRSWRLACRKEGINPNQPDRLPPIFAIDGLLNIENGFTYSLDCSADLSKDDNAATGVHPTYCATHIGCGSGCMGDGGGSDSTGHTGSSCCGHGCSGSSCGGSGCGSGCGGGCGGG
jgi:hypothetical protein